MLANVDDGPTKDALPARGWGERAVPGEQLFDLAVDPGEGTNLAGDPGCAPVLQELRDRLNRWMVETRDPLLDGHVPPPAARGSTRPISARRATPWSPAPS